MKLCQKCIITREYLKNPKNDWCICLDSFLLDEKTFILVAIFLIAKSFHFLFLSPHIFTPWIKLWFYTITYARPDQLNLSVALYGQIRSLFPVSQATEQSRHCINSVTEEHFLHFCGSRCTSSHISLQWQQEATNISFFLGRTLHAGWEENTACCPGLINAHQPHSLHIDEEFRKKRKCLCSQRKHSRQLEIYAKHKIKGGKKQPKWASI